MLNPMEVCNEIRISNNKNEKTHPKPENKHRKMLFL